MLFESGVIVVSKVLQRCLEVEWGIADWWRERITVV